MKLSNIRKAKQQSYQILNSFQTIVNRPQTKWAKRGGGIGFQKQPHPHSLQTLPLQFMWRFYVIFLLTCCKESHSCHFDWPIKHSNLWSWSCQRGCDFSSSLGTMLQKLLKCEVKAWFRFYVKSNFGEFKRSKNVIFDNFRGSEFLI